jgi:hypothetical protein
LQSCAGLKFIAPQVSTNGILSFARPFPYHSPHLFPGTSFYNFLIAPFWSDNDIRRGIGEVSYWVHSGQSDSLTFVSTYISQQEQVKFNGTWMLAAEWRNVPEYLGNISIVIKNSLAPKFALLVSFI